MAKTNEELEQMIAELQDQIRGLTGSTIGSSLTEEQKAVILQNVPVFFKKNTGTPTADGYIQTTIDGQPVNLITGQ